MDEIKTSYLDISQRGITTENLAKFKGVDRQLLIEVEPSGSMRPVLMDGKTLGGKDKLVLKSEFDAIKDNIASTESFVDKTSAQEISGLKTFTTLPQSLVDPTNDSDLVTKKYADKDATNTQKGVVQLQNTVDNTEDKAATPRAVNSVKTMVENAQESIETVNTAATEAGRVASEAKSQANTNATSIGTLGSLTTTAKDNLVHAINEVNTTAKNTNIARKNVNNSFSADQTFTKNISVTGTTTLTGNLTSNGTTITKAIDCNGNADVSGTLAVTGTTTLKGATTLTGATKIVDDTFTYDGSNILITKKDANTIFSKTSQIAKGTNPTTAQRLYTYLTDKDSSSSGINLLAGLMLGYEPSGDSQAILFAGNTNASQRGTGAIKITYDKSANKFVTYAPTPVDSSNTTEIATTAWVRKNVPSISGSISGISSKEMNFEILCNTPTAKKWYTYTITPKKDIFVSALKAEAGNPSDDRELDFYLNGTLLWTEKNISSNETFLGTNLIIKSGTIIKVRVKCFYVGYNVHVSFICSGTKSDIQVVTS